MERQRLDDAGALVAARIAERVTRRALTIAATRVAYVAARIRENAISDAEADALHVAARASHASALDAVATAESRCRSSGATLRDLPVAIWVWRGDRVLTQRGDGLAVVAARSEEDAWSILGETDQRAFNHLDIGHPVDDVVRDDMDPEAIEAARRAGYPIRPKSYRPEDLPVLILEGSD